MTHRVVPHPGADPLCRQQLRSAAVLPSSRPAPTWRRVLLWLAIVLSLAAGVRVAALEPAGAGHDPAVKVFGPTVYTRGKGQPAAVTTRFSVKTAGAYTLRVESDGVASAVIAINGVTVLEPDDFTMRVRGFHPFFFGPCLHHWVWIPFHWEIPVRHLHRRVTLARSNTITVELRGKPGGRLKIWIEADQQPAEPPRITAALSPAANAAGWHRSNVTVTFACTAGSSPIVECPQPVVVSTEGTGQVIAGTVRDTANGTATASVTLNIDQTPPLLGATLQPAANSAGWHNTDVTVQYACTDALSGIAACPPAAVVSTEGAQQLVAATATDQAGNTAVHQATINIDKTAPTIGATQAPVANEHGWNNAPVTVAFGCLDALSGIASCTPPVTVGDGAAQSLAGEAIDLAGNRATTTHRVNVDLAPPLVTVAQEPAANAAGWNKTPVTLTFTCSDVGAGVASCPDPTTFSTEGRDQRVAAVAVDRAGNTAPIERLVHIDVTPPEVTATPSATGWSREDVTVTYTCRDALAGVETCPTPATVTAEGADQAVGVTVTDRAGNEARGEARVSIDKTPPTVAASVTPPPNERGWHNTPVTVSFTCQDLLSGVTTCPAPVPLSGEGAGLPATGTATDFAGNTATITLPINIDTVPPHIEPHVSPEPNAAGWHRSNVTVTFACTDGGSGVRTCPAPLAFGTEGASHHATGQAIDQAGNAASASSMVRIDKTAPYLVIQFPAEGALFNVPALTVTGTALDALSGIATVTCSGAPAAHQDTVFTCDATLSPGANAIAAIATDAAGNTSTKGLTVSFNPNRPPTAQAGGPYTSDVAAPLTLDGRASSDPDGDILTYTWDFGDGTTGTGNLPRHTYATSGSFTATLVVDDARGGRATASASVTIRPANGRPTASCGGPYSGVAGVPVAFDASRSADPDGDALTYAWTFGDGTAATGVSPTHVYAAPGAYSVSVTVADGRGGTSSAGTQTVVVAANRAPMAVAGGPYAGEVGMAVSFDASGSHDPDGDLLTYSWNFGDGGVSTGKTPSRVYESPGTYRVTLTVNDGRGGTHTQTTSATIAAHTNLPPLAAAGGPYTGEIGLPVAFDGSASSDPERGALTFAWDFGDGATGTGPTPTHPYAAQGTFTVTLTVADAQQLQHSIITTAVVGAAADRAPPVVTLAGPAEVLPGTQAIVTAIALDNVKVDTVTFAIDAAPPTELTVPPYQRTIDIPAVATPGATILVRATARDPSGNAASAEKTLTIAARPDTEPPAVTLHHPGEAGAGSALRLTASAGDNVGVASVMFSANGTVVATDAEAPYEATYQIPGDAPIGSAIALTAVAVDHTGNREQAVGSTLIVGARDEQAPTVRLTAPEQAHPGAALSFAAAAEDNAGIASVALFVEGVRLASCTSGACGATYTIPPSAPAGTRVRIEARATDFSGLEGTAAATTLILATSTLGEGVISGEVYDDSTGLPLHGAEAKLIGSDNAGRTYEATAVTDHHGQYVLRGGEGQGVVRITRPGWTSVDRPVAIAPNRAATPIDARLTPAGFSREISALLGGTVEHGDVRIAIPPGALPTNSSLTLTRLSAQGLQGILPAGWSPVAAVDAAPHNIPFSTPATIAIPAPASLPPDAILVVAAWSEPDSYWRALGTVTASGDEDGSIEFQVPASGAFALLRPDANPAAPPMPEAGTPLAGVAVVEIPASVSAVVDPQPRIIFYKPGARSEVRGSIAAAPDALLPSGTRVLAQMTESYQFFSGAKQYPEPFTQDLFVYQQPGTPESTAAVFQVSPSYAFEPNTLEKGVITVELQAPAAVAVEGGVIGAAGGSVTAPTGESLDVPPGATDDAIPVSLAGVSVDRLGLAIPDDVIFVDAVNLTLGGATLQASAVVSVPRPGDVLQTHQVVVARIEQVQGQTRFVLTALARVDSDRIVSTAALPINRAPLDGIRTGGRYVFLRTRVPVGYLAGFVLGTTGLPFANAVITTEGFSLLSRSMPSGQFVAAGRVGGIDVTAVDAVKADSGRATITIARAAEEIALDLRLVSQPPRIVSVTPAHGAANVPLASPVVVRFSEPIDPATLSGQQAVNLTVADAAGVRPATLSLSGGNTVATLRPVEPFAPNQQYTITVAGAIKDASGNPLASPLTATFTTLDTDAPPPPAAGAISASIPGPAGTTTVTATQGTAGVHDTVTIENVTRGTSTPVLVDANGGFIVLVQASLSDRLRVTIRDRGGNETTVDLPRFTRTNADGSISTAVDAAGGRIEGPGGVLVDIPQGAFPSGTVVTLKPVTREQFPYQFTEQQLQHFAWSGGLELDLGGATPTTYLRIGIPRRGDEKPDDQWGVAMAVTIDGVTVPNFIDTARLNGDRIVTASPPCPGVTGSGVYGFLKSARPMGMVYGNANVPRDLPSSVWIPFLMGPMIVLRPGYAGMAWGVVQTFRGNVPDPFGLGPWITAAQTGLAAIQPVCMPIVSGRITVTPNQVRLNVDGLTVDDRELIITNQTRGTTLHRYAPFPVTVSVPGANGDRFAVQAVDWRGSRTVSAAAIPRNFVAVQIAKAQFQSTDRRVSIRNLTTQGSWSSALSAPMGDVKILLEGTPSDSYAAEAFGPDDLPRSLTLTTTDYPIGNGNLLVKGTPGSIDPTREEIDAHNAGLPDGQKITGAGITDVVLERRTSSSSVVQSIYDGSNPEALVGGAFAVTIDGDFGTDSFYVHMRYEDGKYDATPLPRFHITVEDPATGKVLREVQGQAPPPDEPFFVDTSATATAGSLVSNPHGYLNVDPRTPITLVFSQALSPSSVGANLLVYEVGTGRRVSGTWRLSNGDRTATFVPDGGLKLDTEYRISMVGVTFAGGAPLETTSLQVRTFKPKRISTLSLTDPLERDPLPFGDIALVQQPTLEGRRETAVAVTTQQGGFKLKTIDVTDAANPVLLGSGSVGSIPRRVVVQRNVAVPSAAAGPVDVMYDVPLVPQQTGMSCWAASAAMIVAWRDQQSIDPAQIAARVGYWLQYHLGYALDDPSVFNVWGLTTEPAQTYTVEAFKHLLERYGPLWVASAEPGTHVRVVTGLSGDGTPNGTLVYINDPWESGMEEFRTPNAGAQYVESYSEFVRKQSELGGDLMGDDSVYVAHLSTPVTRPKTTRRGDLAVASAANLYEGFVAFVDVTDPQHPRRVGGKIILANPDNLSSYTEHGTYKGIPYARGVAAIAHDQGHAAYTTFGGYGLSAVDVGRNMPEVHPDARELEGMHSGDYQDVLVLGGRVFALNKNGNAAPSLDVFDPSLTPLGSAALDDPGANPSSSAGRLAGALNVAVDRNADGTVAADERFDLVFVGGQQGLTILNVNDPTNPAVVGSVPLGGPVRQMAAAVDGKSVLAGLWRNGEVGVTAWYLIDTSNPFKYGLVDGDGDQRDDRIAYEVVYPQSDDPKGFLTALAFDAGRGLAFVGTSRRLEVWAMSKSAALLNNDAPTADAGVDQEVEREQAVSLDGSRSRDGDGDALTYAWTQVSGPIVELSSHNTARPTFTAPDQDNIALEFQLVVNDGLTDSAPDTVVIKVGKDELTVEPAFAAIVKTDGRTQLTVKLRRVTTGTQTDVTADEDTTYEWSGNGTGLPDVTPVLSTLSAKLGVTVSLAQISISDSGLLTASSAGIQVVRVKHGSFTSDPIVVVVGFSLAGIHLVPEADLTQLAGIVGAGLGARKNAPLLLASSGTGFLRNTGTLRLDDVTFKFASGGTIAIKPLAEALKPLMPDILTPPLSAQGPTVPLLAQAFARLVSTGEGGSTDSFSPLTCAESQVAEVTPQGVFKALVTARATGLGAVTGTLDLGDWGKADDSVAVFVLGPGALESVQLDPATTEVTVTSAPLPGAAVRTYAMVNLARDSAVTVTGTARTSDDLLARFLPDDAALWPSGISRDTIFNTPAPNLRIHLEGTATPTCSAQGEQMSCSIRFRDVKLAFPVPTNVAGATLSYTLADQTIGRVGAVEAFDTRLVHQRRLGETVLSAYVSIPPLGPDNDPGGRFAVVEATGCRPCLDVKVVGGATAAAAGQPVTYNITATNKSADPMPALTIIVEAAFQAEDTETWLPVTSWSLDFGVLGPKEAVVRQVTLTAPAQPGTLQTTAQVPSGSSRIVKLRVVANDDDCAPCIEGRLSGNKPALNPLELLIITLTAWNNSGERVDDITLVNTSSLDGEAFSTQRFQVNTLAPHEAVQRTLSVVVPATPGGTFENAVVCDPAERCKAIGATITRPIRRPAINEVVVEPQRDWNDDGPGGDGVPFNLAWGTSVAPSPYVTADDQWVEILTNTGSPDEIEGWTLEFADASGQSRSVTLGLGNMHFFGTYVVVDVGGQVGRDTVISLRDTSGEFVDRIDLAAVQQQAGVGYADGLATESLARIPNGSIGTRASLFKRRTATLGRPNE